MPSHAEQPNAGRREILRMKDSFRHPYANQALLEAARPSYMPGLNTRMRSGKKAFVAVSVKV